MAAEQLEIPGVAPISEKQLAYVKALRDRKLVPPEFHQWTSDAYLESLSAGRASKAIDWFRALPDRPKAQAPEGMHKVGDAIYKVQVAVHGSGHLYAKRLSVSPSGKVTFAYEAGAVGRLSEDTRMSLEDAKAFGALYGTCCVCGRTLTDEKSIEVGIGPVCAGKFS